VLRIGVNQQEGSGGVLGDISGFQTWEAAFHGLNNGDVLKISDITHALILRMHVLSGHGVIPCVSVSGSGSLLTMT